MRYTYRTVPIDFEIAELLRQSNNICAQSREMLDGIRRSKHATDEYLDSYLDQLKDERARLERAEWSDFKCEGPGRARPMSTMLDKSQ